MTSSRQLGLLPLPLAGEGWAAAKRRQPLSASEPNRVSRVIDARINGAATHVESAIAACGGAGGMHGLERRRPPPPSRLLRRLRRALFHPPPPPPAGAPPPGPHRPTKTPHQKDTNTP